MKKADFANKIRAGVAGLAIAASSIAPVSRAERVLQTAPIASQVQQAQAKNIAPVVKQNPKKENILGAIATVESMNGANTKHSRLPQSGIHNGEKAYGTYGLTPVLIRETIKDHADLSKQHESATKLVGSDFHNYMIKHPDLEHEIASRHYDRLSKHFGHNPARIGYAWLNGVVGTKRAIKQKVDIDGHWHVQKILAAYEDKLRKK